MPIYVCKPGWGTAEPWRHGIPVYSLPFPMDDASGTGTQHSQNQHASGDWNGNENPAVASSGGDVDHISSRTRSRGMHEHDGGGIHGGRRNASASASSAQSGVNLTAAGRRANAQAHPDPNMSPNGILREGTYPYNPNINRNQQQQHNRSNRNMRSAVRQQGVIRSDMDTGAEPEGQQQGQGYPYQTHVHTRQQQLQEQQQQQQRSASSSLSPSRHDRQFSESIHGPTANAESTNHAQVYPEAIPIRRVRHSEVVLVDEVSVHYNKYWLRLLWPGSRGGVAGYILVGGMNSVPNDRVKEWKERLRGAVGGIELEGFEVSGGLGMGPGVGDVMEGVGATAMGIGGVTIPSGHSGNASVTANVGANPEDNGQDDNDLDDQHNDSDNDSIVDEPDILHQVGDSNSLAHFTPRCESTGLYFPSTTTMELLAMYHDGIERGTDRAPSVSSIADETDDEAGQGEPVFCRICREGLHEIDYGFETTGQEEGGGGGASSQAATATATHNQEQRQRLPNPIPTVCLPVTPKDGGQETGEADVENSSEPHSQLMKRNKLGRNNSLKKSSPPPIPAEQINHPYAANPLLSPCECSGSMAFVHYLCIEQWRCRSHHPAAENGLNCETCNARYTLPPPPSRPDVNEEEDWLDAMPPHVLAALRRPHPCWQIGAAVVRRRWLRPIAPVVTSPVVALYCRARRTLKKRGVSRRRWACSLCRRRARWKCVRCLRSYYCSRQCQNVSWHIVHKHVCYKPVRFWWSVAVYGLAFIYCFPGVLSYPVMYDLSFSFLWLSFVVTGIIGGGIATILKKQLGVDIRGRGLEALVVIVTFWLASICWGLVWAFFGDSDECKGVFNYDFRFGFSSETSAMQTEHDPSQRLGLMSAAVRYFILKPAKEGIFYFDNFLLKCWPVSKWICTSDKIATGEDATESATCLELTRNANPEFMTGENGGNCSSDVNTVMLFWMMAVCMHGMSYMLKTIDRHRRAAAAAARRPRPHQD